MTEFIFLVCVISSSLIVYYVTDFLLNKFYVKRINLTTTHQDGTLTKQRLSKDKSKALYELIKKQGEPND